MIIKRPNPMKPSSTLLDLLRPRKALWGTIRGSGRWELSFPQRGDLLFFRVDHGSCQLYRIGVPPLPLATGDCVVLRTDVQFALASDADVKPIDSWALVGSTRSTEIYAGDGREPSVLIRGGRLELETDRRDPLLGLLPPLVHVPDHHPRSSRLRALLAMVEEEDTAPDAWSAKAGIELLQLLLVELIRVEDRSKEPFATGLLAGLRDPVVSHALTAMHGDVGRSWTLAALARCSGRSRSGFSQRFEVVLGLPPKAYLRQLRLEVAKDELRRGRRSVAEIALLVGFQSSSAFSNAFARAVGCSATAYAERQTRRN